MLLAKTTHAWVHTSIASVHALRGALSALRIVNPCRARTCDVLQVTFPEKAGALRQFLAVLMGADNPEQTLNVTMFHYRTTGNRASSVLLGIQVPPSREAAYEAVKDELEPLEFAFDELDAGTRHLFDQFIS